MNNQDLERVKQALVDAELGTFVEPDELPEGESVQYVSIGLIRPITPAGILNALHKANLLGGTPDYSRRDQLGLTPLAYLPDSITFEDTGARI